MLIRTANYTDENDLLIWRNDYITRKMSLEKVN